MITLTGQLFDGDHFEWTFVTLGIVVGAGLELLTHDARLELDALGRACLQQDASV